MTFLQKVENAKALIKESVGKYPKIALGCSFGKDSMVTLHLVLQATKKLPVGIPVFAVMADTEFPETYKFADKIVKKYKLNYSAYVFQNPEGVEGCCGDAKVEATKKALEGFDAWISGVRMTEGITRADFKPVEENAGLIKINPILDFTELDIWRYIALYGLPTNPKYKQGFRSLGCKKCSFPEEDENEAERAGRWKGTNKCGGECGIHTRPLR